jgi:hypothetical protein
LPPRGAATGPADARTEVPDLVAGFGGLNRWPAFPGAPIARNNPLLAVQTPRRSRHVTPGGDVDHGLHDVGRPRLPLDTGDEAAVDLDSSNGKRFR